MEAFIKRHDNEGNIIYYTRKSTKKYDNRGNLIYHKSHCRTYEFWREYDKNNNLIYYRNNQGREEFYRYENNKRMRIIEQEFKYIKFLTRKRVRRYEILDI